MSQLSRILLSPRQFPIMPKHFRVAVSVEFGGLAVPGEQNAEDRETGRVHNHNRPVSHAVRRTAQRQDQRDHLPPSGCESMHGLATDVTIAREPRTAENTPA
jgi:hypothetical protein